MSPHERLLAGLGIALAGALILFAWVAALAAPVMPERLEPPSMWQDDPWQEDAPCPACCSATATVCDA